MPTRLRRRAWTRLHVYLVNDAFVMGAWAMDQGTGETIDMLADGSGELAKEMDIELDLAARGLGVRGKRFALVAEDGVVKHFALQDGGELHDFECRRNVKGALDDRLLILRMAIGCYRGHFSFGLVGHGTACEGIRAFVLWMPGMPLTQCHSTSWSFRASYKSCQRSTFFTGFLAAVRQPLRFQLTIHFVMPSFT